MTTHLTHLPHTHPASMVYLSQVVRQVVVNVCGEAVAIFRVKLQHLLQSSNADVLQVAVGKRLHISIRLDQLVLPRDVCANQVSLT